MIKTRGPYPHPWTLRLPMPRVCNTSSEQRLLHRKTQLHLQLLSGQKQIHLPNGSSDHRGGNCPWKRNDETALPHAACCLCLCFCHAPLKTKLLDLLGNMLQHKAFWIPSVSQSLDEPVQDPIEVFVVFASPPDPGHLRFHDSFEDSQGVTTFPRHEQSRTLRFNVCFPSQGVWPIPSQSKV